MGNHEMPPNRAACEVRAHIGKLCDRDQIQDVKLPSQLACARTRSQINDFGDEIVEPKDVKQTKQRVGHRLQWLIVAQTRKHLSPKDRQQKKEQDRNFEII